MKEIKAVVQPFMLDNVLDALREYSDPPGVTVSQVVGWGKTRAARADDVDREGGLVFVKKTKIEIVLDDDAAETVVDLIARATKTGRPGDGKIFIYNVEDVVKIRTGERGVNAV